MATKLDDTLARGLEEVRKDLQLLLDRDVRFGLPSIEWVEGDSPSSRRPLDVEMIVDAETPGCLRMRFDAGVGILMSGLLMMVGEDVIATRMESGEIEEADADPVAEVGNQVAGSLNTGLSAARDGESCEIRRGEVWLTGEPGPKLQGAGPFLRVEQPIEITGFPAGSLLLVFDSAGAEAALGATPATTAAGGGASLGVAEMHTSVGTRGEAGFEAGAWAPGDPTRSRTDERPIGPCLLVLYETRADGWETAQVIQETTGWPIIIQRLDGSARRRLLAGGVGAVVIDTGEGKERGLTACGRLVRLINGADIAVFIASPSWRREEVQRAIQAGVSGILVKPLDPDRVRGAIGAHAEAV